jgi:hypothetical protein
LTLDFSFPNEDSNSNSRVSMSAPVDEIWLRIVDRSLIDGDDCYSKYTTKPIFIDLVPTNEPFVLELPIGEYQVMASTEKWAGNILTQLSAIDYLQDPFKVWTDDYVNITILKDQDSYESIYMSPQHLEIEFHLDDGASFPENYSKVEYIIDGWFYSYNYGLNDFSHYWWNDDRTCYYDYYGGYKWAENAYLTSNNIILPPFINDRDGYTEKSRIGIRILDSNDNILWEQYKNEVSFSKGKKYNIYYVPNGSTTASGNMRISTIDWNDLDRVDMNLN